MKTKEAIKFLNSIIIDRKSLKSPLCEYCNAIDEVIELLQCGAKYKQIIDKANKDYYGTFVTFGEETMMELTEFLAGIEEEVMMERR